MNMAEEVNKEEAILKYEKFINDVLKEDLRQFETQLHKVNSEIADLIQQRHALKVVTDKKINPKGFKTQVNLGCNFFMEASVTDTSKLLLNIGLNHYLDLTLSEANVYLNTRITAFEKISEEIQKKAAETKANIKFMLCGLTELYKERNKT